MLSNNHVFILTHYNLVESSTVGRVFLGLSANNVDPDQMPHYVASDLGLHCLPMTL